jgi:hypothetical protein
MGLSKDFFFENEPYRPQDEEPNPVVVAQSAIDQLSSKEKAMIHDGYHSFDELYQSRNAAFIALAIHVNQCIINGIMRPNEETDEKGFFIEKDKRYVYKSYFYPNGIPVEEGWFLLYLDTGTGQISMHLPDNLWEKVAEIREVKEMLIVPKYDGHKTADVIERLLNV